MNIYHLTRTDHPIDRDQLRALVVIAPDERAARYLAADESMDEGTYVWFLTDVIHIGTAVASAQSGVVCADVFEG